MNEQPLNLRASLQEIWRRRLLLITVALLGGLGGVAYGLLWPAKESAVALVLLPPNSASNSTSAGNTGNTGAAVNGINTDAVIARSTPVLAAAGTKISPPISALGVRKLITVTPLSGQILQIEAQSPASSSAVSLANAVAQSYVSYIDQLETTSAGPGVATLQNESRQLKQQIDDLQRQIDSVSARIAAEGAGSNSGQLDTALLGSLRNEQNQVAVQLNTVTSQIASAQLANGSTTSTTRILQPATAQPTSRYSVPLEAGIIGFAVGLVGAVSFVLVRFQREHRLRLRDEFARVAGAPVIASLDAPGCTTSSAWRELLDVPPRATTQWALRHVLHSLPRRERRAVRVIVFAGDNAALSTGPQLALHAARTGTPTVMALEDSGTHVDHSLTSLRAAFTGAHPVGKGLPLSVGPGHANEVQPNLLVSLVVFNGRSPDLAHSAAANLLSISPGFVTADELARLALAAADGGFALDGVIVVNPDPFDTTTGQITDATVRPLSSPSPAEPADDELGSWGRRTSSVASTPGRGTQRDG